MASKAGEDLIINFEEITVKSNPLTSAPRITVTAFARVTITNNRSTKVTIDELQATYWPDYPNPNNNQLNIFHKHNKEDWYTLPAGESNPVYEVQPGETKTIEFDVNGYTFKGSNQIWNYVDGEPLRGFIAFLELPNVRYLETTWGTAKTVPWNYAPNTGYKAWFELEEYYLDDGTATGNTKPNDPADPDYVAPIYDTSACPLP